MGRAQPRPWEPWPGLLGEGPQGRGCAILGWEPRGPMGGAARIWAGQFGPKLAQIVGFWANFGQNWSNWPKLAVWPILAKIGGFGQFWPKLAKIGAFGWDNFGQKLAKIVSWANFGQNWPKLT